MQSTILDELKEIRTWDFPKFFALRRFERVKFLGALTLTDTSHLERSNKEVKADGHFTNNDPNDRDRQVAVKVHGGDVLRRAAEGEGSKKRKRTSRVSSRHLAIFEQA